MHVHDEPAPDAPAMCSLEAAFPLAFAVLAHGNLDHLARLVARLSECPNDTVVVHLDRRMAKSLRRHFKERFSNSSNVLYAPSRRCYWGGWSLVDASFRCIDCLADSARPFKYLSLLSGTDYPIRSIDEFREYLSSRNGVEFIEAYNIAWEDFIKCGFTTGRYEYVFPFARDVFHPLLFSVWQAVLETLDIRRCLPSWVLPYGGSQWWTLTAEAVDYLRQTTIRRRVKAVFGKAFVPDEHVFQIALMASPFRAQVAHDNLRYVLPSPAGGPNWLYPADMAQALDSGQFFARKIAPEHSLTMTALADSATRTWGCETFPNGMAPSSGKEQYPPPSLLKRVLASAYWKLSRKKPRTRTGLSLADLPLRGHGRRIVIVAMELAEQAEQLAQFHRHSCRTCCIRLDKAAANELFPAEMADGVYFTVVRGVEDITSIGPSPLPGPTEIYLDLCIGDSRQTKNKMIDELLHTGFMFDSSLRDQRFLRFVERPQKRGPIWISWI
ncbi:MAG: beta-1,6-N-acetylglucosaminyltransferase [Methylococcaceae bacterium]|nr:beta-1,6-N-acetylglucosaminyltransferase [Methylococcaceae bacterium]